MRNSGIPVEREQLQPGDLIVRLGENSHAMMFLSWEEDGRMTCIHETGGLTDNYRSLLD